MKIIYTLKEFQQYRKAPELEFSSIGFVPTMGALHSGHLSLVQVAKETSDIVIISIFVNPTQFNDPNDLKNYPREYKKDIEKLTPLKPDVIFIPGVDDIYPEKDSRQFNFGQLDKVMEGATRPGHFNGVAQVVSKLFDIVSPNRAFFGQKDFQQLAIIRSLVKQNNYNIDIVSCPIIREKNGLAMSSRNSLLSERDRNEASFIFKVLKEAKESFSILSLEEVIKNSIEKFTNNPNIELIYFDIVDTESLDSVRNKNNNSGLIACVAVKINSVRLIDNLIFV